MTNHRAGEVGRQSRLSLRKAISISINSLKIRFWRSMVTAGGVFLGIAFLSTVLTQSLMRFPAPVTLKSGQVRVEGQVKSPGDFAMVKARTLGDAVRLAGGVDAKSADLQEVMLVNKSGGKLSFDLKANPSLAATRLECGDIIGVSDINERYRSIWLVVMSLLVCTVGITNSMLMSVTERFKEIGTMKCLGALDSFIVTLFLLESGMMGICASVMGWAVGFGITVLAAGFGRGWGVVGGIGFVDIARMFGEAVAIGLILTILATIAPAKRAADMPAAMALRREI